MRIYRSFCARRSLPLLLIALATAGCAPGLRSVRVRTAEGQEWTATPQKRAPVAITEDEFQSAIVSLARNVVPEVDPIVWTTLGPRSLASETASCRDPGQGAARAKGARPRR